MNESSDGFSFQFHLDTIRFLTISSFWSFSYDHSYIAFHDARPAGVVIDTVDRDEREAFTFYWGVNQPFRKTTLGFKLLMTYLDQVAREGFHRNYGNISPDSPRTLYERIGCEVKRETLQMESAEAYNDNDQYTRDPRIEEIRLEDFLADRGGVQDEPATWSLRPNSIRTASRWLRFVKFNDIRAAYYPHSTGSVVIDLKGRDLNKEHVSALLGQIALSSNNKRCTLSYVLSASPLAAILTELGYKAAKRATSIVLDLQRWQTRRHQSE
jgi:hypothetical protein